MFSSQGARLCELEVVYVHMKYRQYYECDSLVGVLITTTASACLLVCPALLIFLSDIKRNRLRHPG